MRTNNIVFKNISNFDNSGYEAASMSSIGFKSGLLLTVCLISACISMVLFKTFAIQSMLIYSLCIIATVILQLVITFLPHLAKSLSILYVIFEGVVIGIICGLLEYVLPDEGFAIASCALIITLGIVLAACILYSNMGLRAKPGFIKFMFIVMIGISIGSLFFAIVSLILKLTTGVSLWSLYLGSSFSILASVVMVLIASIYVFITIQHAYTLVEYGISRTYEWYTAFGIAISVIWLFLEIFTLLLKVAIRNRRD